MNESGRSAGPARGAFKLDLDRILVVHDEIDLPFGEVRVRLGGGLAGHNGLKSLRRELGSPDFHRVRVGVGRPDSTDPDVVAAHVLGRWRQSGPEVDALVERARDEVERLVAGG
ncbi:MAG: peptidyl-tRNA hydrolase, family [Solirubrobacteraceae bacterium]|jgi:PTH1 family peptidyl-tRNA hydrolase|nr:peptidyl-tRNA hydrolase, family [Solirubrobacteraceae bacterium]